jgi:hypothetical protein
LENNNANSGPDANKTASQDEPLMENAEDLSSEIPIVDESKTQAAKPEKKREILTMVGPAASGKTHVLAADASAESIWHDTSYGPDAVDACSFNFEVLPGVPTSKSNFVKLRDRYDRILLAEEKSEGTDIIFEYIFSVGFTADVITAPVKAPEPKSRKERKAAEAAANAQQATVPKRTNMLFDLIDGRGADLTAFRYNDNLMETDQKYLDDHYRALTAAKGAMICLPWRSTSILEQSVEHEVPDRDIDGLENLLKSSEFAKSSQLDYIAVCISKYELAFLNDGANAYLNACDRETGLELLKQGSYKGIFLALRDYQANLPSGRTTKIAIFPCSTYGFVNGNGAANYYPSSKYPGLLTRSLSSLKLEDNPDLQNHFPVPLSDAKASDMWHPFNLGSPMLFATTGRLTGPLGFYLSEVIA